MTDMRNPNKKVKSTLDIGRLLVVGGGNMGEALLAGFLAAELVAPDQVTVIEPNEEKRTQLEKSYGVASIPLTSGLSLCAHDVCLLAVKPQIVPTVLPDLALRLNGALLISLAVGITLEALQDALPAATPVVRVMPNTPAMVGCGMALLSTGEFAQTAHMQTVVRLFESVGRTAVIAEDLQNAAAAISGSGPAYFALIIDALSRAGVAQGLPRALAQELATQTAYGTAQLLFQTGQHPEIVIDQVASPGGTTIRAIAELEAKGVRNAFFEAVEAATWRAEELEADFFCDDDDDDDDDDDEELAD